MQSETLVRLLEISRMMAETRSLRPLLTYAVDVSLEMFEAEYGYLVLVRSDGTLDFVVRRDRAGNDIDQPEQQISNTIFLEVVGSGRPVLTSSAVTDPTLKTIESIYSLQLRSVLCVPLITREKIIGAIYLENRSEDNIFNEEALEPLQYLASQAAVSIQNAMLNDQLQSLLHQRDFVPYNDKTVSTNRSLNDLDTQLAIHEERMQVMTGFIENASHQFRTPMSVINTSVDLIRRKIDPVPVSNYLDNIQSQVRTVTNLVDSLVEIIRLDAQVDIDVQKVNVTNATKDMVSVFGHRMNDKKIKFVTRIPREPIMVRGDAELIRQAIGHLLDNALRYTSQGGRVQFGLRTEDGHVIISVEDNGIGIDAVDVEHIFSRFYRVDKAGTTRGLGLGLSVVKRIMQMHGGTADVESALGEGSLFQLILPIAEVSE